MTISCNIAQHFTDVWLSNDSLHNSKWKFINRIITSKSVHMKTQLLSFIACLSFSSLLSADVLTLNNEMRFEGKVKKIKNCSVYFEAADHVFEVPASDIQSLEFDDVTDPVYLEYLTLLESDPNACLNGGKDALNYHGKKGGHFVLGVLFGPFAIIATALSNPTPMTGKNTMLLSQNKEQFSDPEYLNCYKKKAKGQLIQMEALGWGAWVLLLLLF